MVYMELLGLNWLGVEFFDREFGWSCRNIFYDFHQSFCHGFGVDREVLVQGLRIGVDGKEAALGCGTGKKCA